MIRKIRTGNLHKNSKEKRGWVIGHFMEEETGLKTQNFEVKLAEHKKGESEERLDASVRDKTKTLVFLIRGKYVFSFSDPNREVVLSKEGDYVFYGASAKYIRRAEEDSLVVVLRWPSIPSN